MLIEKIDKSKIIQEIIEEGYYIGQSITYEDVQKLNGKYGRGLKDVEFAQRILGVNYNSFLTCKNKGVRIRIFKEEKRKVIGKKQEIIQEIMEAGYNPGQSIIYEELNELYRKYGQGLKESDFAQEILCILYVSYKDCKNKGKEVKILKTQEKKTTKEEREKIKEEIIEAGYHSGQFITYEELNELYERYGQGLKKVDFAEKILGISYSSYIQCKNKGQKAKILKKQEEEITEEEIQEIIQKIMDAGYYAGQSIMYEELNELYRSYGRGVKDVFFAEMILGISYSSYMNCKTKGKKAIILKTQEKKIIEERIQKIKEGIIESGYHLGQFITYKELNELYRKFGRELKEVDFAKKVLGISYSTYIQCKNKGYKVKILKEQVRIITEEERQEIIQKIMEAGYYSGQLIMYEELNELYRKYGQGLKESNFAEKILGITYSNYVNCKNRGTNIIIKDGIKIEKAREIISLYTLNSQLYSKEYIEEICSKYNITIDDFITYIYLRNFYDTTVFISALEKNNGLWIGKIKMSKEFVEKNIEKIETVATEIAYSLCSKYRISQIKEDYKHDIIIYMIENMGDLEKNFGSSNEAFNIMMRKIKRKYEGVILQSLKISNKYEGMYKKGRRSKHDNEFEVEYSDESINIEEVVEEKIEREEINQDENQMEECINILKRCIERGMKREEALESTAKSMNINKEEMLKYMQEYLFKRGKIRLINGKVIPGAPTDPSEGGRS